MLLPILLMGIFLAVMSKSVTRPYFEWLLEENHPVELLTFVFLLAGGSLGLRLSHQLHRLHEPIWVCGFYAAFSLCVLFVAMEEVAWGQWLFGFETPSAFKAINAQGELTLHNVQLLQGHSEFFRLTFGLGGLIGCALSVMRLFRKIAPPIVLLPWFLVISAHAGLDLWNDYSVKPILDYTMSRTSELVEMLIGMTALLFIWRNDRMLKQQESRIHK